MATKGGFQFDARSHHLELAYVQLCSERATIKGQLALLNLKLAQVVREYGKYNGMSTDEANMVLIRVLRLSANEPPNFSI